MSVATDMTIVYAAGKAYRENLCDRKILFIPNDRTAPLEVTFKAENFMHLCGMQYPVAHRRDFLDMAVNQAIDARFIHYTYNNQTEQKLKVLGILMWIDVKASLFSLNPSLPGNTKADCVAVNQNAVLGFTEFDRMKVPDTALNLERRWENPHMIIAVAKTEPLSSVYSILSKQPKGRKLTKDKIHRILASLNQYEGDGDITPIVEKFHAQITML